MYPWFCIAWDFLTTEFTSRITFGDTRVKMTCLHHLRQSHFSVTCHIVDQIKTNYTDILFLIKHLELCLIFTCLELILLFFLWYVPYSFIYLMPLLSRSHQHALYKLGFVSFLYLSNILYRVLFFWLFCHNKIV